MVNILLRISWSKLSAEGVFNGEPVLTCFKQRALRKPAGCEDLERVAVLAGLDALPLGELDHDLLHRGHFLHLPVVVLHSDNLISTHMTPFDTLKLNDKVSGVKRFTNLDVNGAGDGFSRVKAEHIVVEVNVDGALKVEVEGLIPEHSRVLLDFR